MVIIEILLALGVVSVAVLAIYAGYKIGKHSPKDNTDEKKN